MNVSLINKWYLLELFGCVGVVCGRVVRVGRSRSSWGSTTSLRGGHGGLDEKASGQSETQQTEFVGMPSVGE